MNVRLVLIVTLLGILFVCLVASAAEAGVRVKCNKQTGRCKPLEIGCTVCTKGNPSRCRPCPKPKPCEGKRCWRGDA